LFYYKSIKTIKSGLGQGIITLPFITPVTELEVKDCSNP